MKVHNKQSGKRGPVKKGKVNKGLKSRKDLRKEKRMAKKIKKQQHTTMKSRQGKQTDEDIAVAVETAVPNPPKLTKKMKRELIKQAKATNKSQENDRSNVTAQKTKLEKEMKKHRAEQLKLANQEEDKNIKKLEKLMKMNKRKSKKLPRAFVDEGLDYLLEVCDPERMSSMRQDPSLLESSDSEFEDDLAQVTGKKKADSDENNELSDGSEEVSGEDISEDEELVDSEEVEDEMGSMEEDFSDEDVPEEPVSVKSGSKKRVKFQDEVDGNSEMDKKKQKVELKSTSNDEIEDNEDENVYDENSEDLDETTERKKEGGETWEDIYGRVRDKKGNVVEATAGKYIPPALRALSTDSAKLARLKRQMQGLLNRLAEGNMASVASQMEQIISSTSRGDSNEVLGQLLHALAPAGSVTPPRMVAEHALLLALLHAHIGADIGAAFLQATVEKFDLAYKECKEVENKTLNNFLQMLCFMYSFKIFHCTLIFDIIEKLGTGFEEKDVELILLILKTVGPSLRKDDPAALKNAIIQLQKQASTCSNAAENSRVSFMLDILLAIKNNNMSKIPDYDPDLVDRLRKLLRALLRSGSSVSELKISLNDLLNAQQRGKWWVVGSAWQGAGPGEKSSSTGSSNSSSQFSQKLLELARKQRMNTELRKNVFCILMTAEDFIDAFEKLLHLGLKGQQEREIPYVILDCCLQEQNFNPYYAHLSQKFCDFDRKYKMSIQCSIWDKIKELNRLSKGQIRNLASFTAFLILSGGLTLAVLKVIQFSDLDKTKVKFIRQVLLSLLLAKKEEECVETFTRLPASGQLALFREGMRLFLLRYILGQGAATEGVEAELLKNRVSIAERLLVNQNNKVRF